MPKVDIPKIEDITLDNIKEQVRKKNEKEIARAIERAQKDAAKKGVSFTQKDADNIKNQMSLFEKDENGKFKVKEGKEDEVNKRMESRLNKIKNKLPNEGDFEKNYNAKTEIEAKKAGDIAVFDAKAEKIDLGNGKKVQRIVTAKEEAEIRKKSREKET